MKTITIMNKLLLLIPILILVSCNRSQKLSDAYGNFEAVTVSVSSETAGRILQMNIEEGQEVEQGQLIAVIDTTDLYLKLLQLQAQKKAVSVKNPAVAAQIAVQEQQKANLLLEKNRVEKLLADNAATPKQLDDINGSLRLIDKQISQINTQNAGIAEELEVIDRQMVQVKETIKRSYIKSPLSGTVLSKYAETGEVAAPGKVFCKIADMSFLELRVFVSGSIMPKVKLGNNVEVLIDKNEKENQKLEGKVSWISQKAEFTPKIIQTKEERVNLVYAVKIRVKNDGGLKIAMPGEVNF